VPVRYTIVIGTGLFVKVSRQESETETLVVPAIHIVAWVDPLQMPLVSLNANDVLPIEAVTLTPSVSVA
jgi:hypothetical protein